MHGGPHGALSLGGCHAGGQGPPILLADVRRHLLRHVGTQALHGLGQESHEEIVPPLHEPDRQFFFDAEELLGWSSGSRSLATRLDPEVPAVHQALQVVASHIGVEGERERHLGGRQAGRGPDTQEDVAPGGIAKGGRNCGHGGREAPVVSAGSGLGRR